MIAGIGFDRGRRPTSGAVQAYHFPGFERHHLDSGVTLLLARAPRAPLVSMRWLVSAGAASEPENRAGLATLTAGLLDDGTRRRGAEEISDLIETLGGSLQSGADWDIGSVEITVSSRHQAEGLELLLEVATESTFPEAEVARALALRRDDLLRRRTQPGAQADLALLRGLYRESTYGRSIYGDLDQLERLTRDGVVRFYAERYDPASATLIAAGDVDAAELLARVRDLGGGEQRPGLSSPRPVAPPGRRRVLLLDRPGAPQTELRLGLIGVARHDPDYVALRCLATLLGGKYTSRLNLVLRQELGFTYGVSCTQSSRWGRAPFSISTAIATDGVGRAVSEMLAALERLRAEPVFAAELADTISYLTGTFPFQLQTVSGIADRLEEIAAFGLPDDAIDRYQQDLRSLEPEHLERAARRHLHPEEAVIVAVGDARRLEPQLEPFGEVERISAS